MFLSAGKRAKWLKFNTFKATIMDVLEDLNKLVDESDPDVDVPNIVHAFQTAEGIRKDHPDKPWFQLTGLIHDIGKVRGNPYQSSVIHALLISIDFCGYPCVDYGFSIQGNLRKK